MDELAIHEIAWGQPNHLGATDITRHPTLEGKVYCCPALDAFSRSHGIISAHTRLNR